MDDLPDQTHFIKAGENFDLKHVSPMTVDLGSMDEIKGEKVEIVSPSVNCNGGY